LFNIFEEWVQETTPGTSSIGKGTFSKTIANIQDYSVVRVQTGPRIDNVTPRKVAIVNLRLILI
jgi:hypothetical protein